jgi:hypothetical protein
LKVEFEGRVGNFDVYRLETDKPASEVVNLFENVFRDLVRDSLALTVSSSLDGFRVLFEGRNVLNFTAIGEGAVRIAVNRRSLLGEDLVKMAFKTAGLEFPQFPEAAKIKIILEKAREEQLKKLRQSLTEFDYEVLKLRSQGVSLWTIASKLGCSIAKVRWSLQKLALIPETSEKLGAFKPLPWNERFKKH